MSEPAPAHVALIDETGQVSEVDLARYRAALNDQVAEDFGPVWGAYAYVTVETNETRPPNAWALRIKEQLAVPGALGYHSDALNQPYAVVELTEGLPQTLSHELTEMLADPWGNRLRSAPPPAGLDPAQVGLSEAREVRYLLEVADPPQAFSYDVLGVPMSDFILPPWYRSGEAAAYSFMGHCKAPQEVALGGYCSFAAEAAHWWQVFNVGGQLELKDLGTYTGQARSLREWVDQSSREFWAEVKSRGAS
jgi:hypothetical protein